ncbi:hypothetical protein CHS0354_005014 [Potamilus streckersoni]|uniref:Uncharacterized protein n=1 Tax=Potamilus streckersoni TaxID=2493646 RepID=A0AAE0W1X3_9BIVA|nr:hypothetical protein CHS0354_005014 [Potamilus streckersoni]
MDYWPESCWFDFHHLISQFQLTLYHNAGHFNLVTLPGYSLDTKANHVSCDLKDQSERCLNQMLITNRCHLNQSETSLRQTSTTINESIANTGYRCPLKLQK